MQRLEVSAAVRHIYMSLGFKRLIPVSKVGFEAFFPNVVKACVVIYYCFIKPHFFSSALQYAHDLPLCMQLSHSCPLCSSHLRTSIRGRIPCVMFFLSYTAEGCSTEAANKYSILFFWFVFLYLNSYFRAHVRSHTWILPYEILKSFSFTFPQKYVFPSYTELCKSISLYINNSGFTQRKVTCEKLPQFEYIKLRNGLI